MIGTDRFVYVHLPKTGGTFVTSVLLELEDLLHSERLYSWSHRTSFIKTKLKHGTCRDIPRKHRGKPVLSTIRSPHELYVSEYEFGWWKRSEFNRYFANRVRGFRRKYPAFPDLGFEEFVRLLNQAFCRIPRNKNLDSSEAVGWVTERFVRFYFRRPWLRLFRMDEDSISPDKVWASMYDVTFIHTRRLNRELHDYLLELGLPPERLEFILHLGKILPDGKGRADDQSWHDYYTPSVARLVRDRERLLYWLFPEFEENLRSNLDVAV